MRGSRASRASAVGSGSIHLMYLSGSHIPLGEGDRPPLCEVQRQAGLLLAARMCTKNIERSMLANAAAGSAAWWQAMVSCAVARKGDGNQQGVKPWGFRMQSVCGSRRICPAERTARVPGDAGVKRNALVTEGRLAGEVRVVVPQVLPCHRHRLQIDGPKTLHFEPLKPQIQPQFT